MRKEYEKQIQRYVKSLEWLREELLEMDDFLHPVMGIRDWDDSCCIEFGSKKLIASVDGPYTKRLVMKSALIHASTDILVKGGKPLFALDTLIGEEKEIKEMLGSLKRQAKAMKIPLLGGNTMIEEASPRCSLTIVGKLLTKEPIRDSGAKKGDLLVLLGKPIWGEQKERIKKAQNLFQTWYQILQSGIKIHSSKDVTKGGLISTVYEIAEKSGREFSLSSVPFSMTRNLDNFLISLAEENYGKILKICEKNKCAICKIGKIT